MKFTYVLSTLLMASSTVAFTVTTNAPVTKNTRLYGLADDDIESKIARAVSFE